MNRSSMLDLLNISESRAFVHRVITSNVRMKCRLKRRPRLKIPVNKTRLRMNCSSPNKVFMYILVPRFLLDRGEVVCVLEDGEPVFIVLQAKQYSNTQCLSNSPCRMFVLLY